MQYQSRVRIAPQDGAALVLSRMKRLTMHCSEIRMLLAGRDRIRQTGLLGLALSRCSPAFQPRLACEVLVSVAMPSMTSGVVATVKLCI